MLRMIRGKIMVYKRKNNKCFVKKVNIVRLKRYMKRYKYSLIFYNNDRNVESGD